MKERTIDEFINNLPPDVQAEIEKNAAAAIEEEVTAMDIIHEGKFKPVGKELEPDHRKRVGLAGVMPPNVPDVRYRAFRNELGQILLDPVKSVPYHQAGIYENADHKASIQRGIKDIEAGRTAKLDLSEIDGS